MEVVGAKAAATQAATFWLAFASTLAPSFTSSTSQPDQAQAFSYPLPQAPKFMSRFARRQGKSCSKSTSPTASEKHPFSNTCAQVESHNSSSSE